MNITYSRTLGRKILLIFLLFSILFSITAFFVRQIIISKLEKIAKSTVTISNNQTRPEQALLLLHQAEDSFQASLLEAASKKTAEYKKNMSRAYKEIDTLLMEQTDTSNLGTQQSEQIKIWYNRKIELSDKLFKVKHNFDSLLSEYGDFKTKIRNVEGKSAEIQHLINESFKNNSDTVRTTLPKKGFFNRLKDAFSYKENIPVLEVNKTNTIVKDESHIQKIAATDGETFIKKLRQLQQENVKLHNMQRDLIILNASIISELEDIINEIKTLNYNMADHFREMALKNYQETASVLNTFHLINLFLVAALAIALIVYVIKLNKSELLLRKENEKSVNEANERIEELIKKIELKEGHQSAPRSDTLKETVQLAIANNPAFIVKFNEFDPNFSKQLLDIAPNLVASELEFCSLLRLNFETKEIARYTKTSVRAVEGKKYRIRKKLAISSDKDINVWMTNLTSNSADDYTENK